MPTVVEVQDLRKIYGQVVAVDGISFDVREGEIFGMVGPNGAGKTTTIECVEGLRPMLFLSGAAIPLEVLPQNILHWSKFLPLTYAVTLMRGLWAGDGWNQHLVEAGLLVGVLLVGAPLSARLFRWEY